ncbi:MAG: metallophosphoesterase family protein [Desulfocapsa sp.]|nr:metallophosphoesterase family protein [Desulfocapsa sp.]
MKILLLSDIHANFSALEACIEAFSGVSFDAICNCGDSIVYGPFPNQTLHWLEANNVYSIIGNTDKKIIKLLKGKSFKKPKKEEKRVMYTWTAEQLDTSAKKYLLSLGESLTFTMTDHHIALFHGSPDHPNEFLFPDTSIQRFKELAAIYSFNIVITGHSHMPYHKEISNTHFINPGSVGRMFDSDPSASCAVLTLYNKTIQVKLHRIPYPVEQTIESLKKNNLPEIYQLMYRLGRKLN